MRKSLLDSMSNVNAAVAADAYLDDEEDENSRDVNALAKSSVKPKKKRISTSKILIVCSKALTRSHRNLAGFVIDMC